LKVVILAGGLGTRLAEETEVKPKPMIEIGGRPILWHILKTYAHFGFDDFYIALGYKGDEIKRYFVDYLNLGGSLSLSMQERAIHRWDNLHENWTLHLMDTGLETLTGGRLKRLQPHLSETFMATYGDGVCNVDLSELLAFHRAHGKLATVTAVRPPARFGGLQFEGDQIVRFTEKPQAGEGWINGGFFVLEPEVLNYIEGDASPFESGPLETLAREGQLMAFRHGDFWQCMDTLRDKRLLESLWESRCAPWKIWD
jgi:glucose-1-phosphate cytidylyltransferase